MRLSSAICVAFLGTATASPEAAMVGYMGGSGTDDCDGIALDQSGDIYLACHSDSSDFPHAPTEAPHPSGGMDAVIVKIAARTGRLLWTTRTGGSAWDAAGDVVTTNDGTVYVLGQTRSADFPTTSDAVQRRFGGPDRDVFLLRLNSEGKVIYSTLLGGAKNDEASGLAVAEDGTVYIGGVTVSGDFPGRMPNGSGPAGNRMRSLPDSGQATPRAFRPFCSEDRAWTTLRVWRSTGPAICSPPDTRPPVISL